MNSINVAIVLGVKDYEFLSPHDDLEALRASLAHIRTGQGEDLLVGLTRGLRVEGGGSGFFLKPRVSWLTRLRCRCGASRRRGRRA